MVTGGPRPPNLRSRGLPPIATPIAGPRRDAEPWRLPFRLTGGALDWVIANAAVAGLYFLLGWVVGRFFAAYGLFPAPIWLPAGIAVVAAMIGRMRLFPGIFFGS